MQKNKTGTLYVVATPIGNLQDITLRAIEILKNVTRIAAEDTRHAAPLLKHFSINKPTISLHEFNEEERGERLLQFLEAGEDIALISDAGTPLISDPGFHLVQKAQRLGIKVIPIPGACAAITALSVSGLPTDRFTFEGFLPAKTEALRHRLHHLIHESRTMIFYEAPRRLLQTLAVMVEIFGSEREAVVARELTKIYESVLSCNLQLLHEYFSAHPDELRGEIVILVAGNKITPETSEVIPSEVLHLLLSELPLKQAVVLTSKITGINKNLVYDWALAKKKE